LIAFIICSCSCLFSCTNNKSSSKEVVSKADAVELNMIDSTQLEPLTEEEEAYYAEPNFAAIREELINSYSDTVISDQVVGLGATHIRIKYMCSFDSAIIIPKNYIWEENGPDSFVTHNFKAEVTILNPRDTVVINLNKEAFEEMLPDNIRSFGTMVSIPSFIQYDQKGRFFELHFSYGIPVTDLGRRVEVKMDSTLSISYEVI